MALSFAIFAAGTRSTPARPSAAPRDAGGVGRRGGATRLLGLFILVMFFWAIFDQVSTTWIFFGQPSWTFACLASVDPDPIQASTPFTSSSCCRWSGDVQVLARCLKFRATDKMVVGFLLTAACMGVMAGGGFRPASRPRSGPSSTTRGGRIVKDGRPVLEYWTPDENKVTVWWQVLAFLIITMAEILISVTGLELAYAAAPKSMTGFVTACWLVTVGMADLLINAPVQHLYSTMPPGYYFSGLAVTLLVVTGAFFFVARQFNRTEARAEAALPTARTGRTACRNKP